MVIKGSRLDTEGLYITATPMNQFPVEDQSILQRCVIRPVGNGSIDREGNINKYTFLHASIVLKGADAFKHDKLE